MAKHQSGSVAMGDLSPPRNQLAQADRPTDVSRPGEH